MIYIHVYVLNDVVVAAVVGDVVFTVIAWVVEVDGANAVVEHVLELPKSLISTSGSPGPTDIYCKM